MGHELDELNGWMGHGLDGLNGCSQMKIINQILQFRICEYLMGEHI